MESTPRGPAAVRFPVEAGHVSMFARAIGDNRAEYQPAPETDRSHVAPPTFVQAGAHFIPHYRLRPEPGQPWFGSGVDSGHLPETGGGLHAEQRFEYHKPVLIGSVLTITTRPGLEWTKEGRRGGSLHFWETITEYRDETGELVVTATAVSVRTEHVVGSTP